MVCQIEKSIKTEEFLIAFYHDVTPELFLLLDESARWYSKMSKAEWDL